jgi:hypothetical protein
MVFDYRKRKAVKIARIRSQKENRKVLVIQFNRHFYTGTREELRRRNKFGDKLLKRTTGSGMLVFDYRNSIVYTADNEQLTINNEQ